MKKLTTANWIAIILFIIGQIIALFSQEQKLTIVQNIFSKMIHHWQLALFIVSTCGLTATILWIIVRNYIDEKFPNTETQKEIEYFKINKENINEILKENKHLKDIFQCFIDNQDKSFSRQNITMTYVSHYLNVNFQQATDEQKKLIVKEHYNIAIKYKIREKQLQEWGLDNEIILCLRKTDYEEKIKSLDSKLNPTASQQTDNKLNNT